MVDKMEANNSSWNDRLEEFLKYAALNPKEFLSYVFLFLTPLMVICGILSLKLAHHIEQRDKEKKKKATRQSNMAKTKKKLKAYEILGMFGRILTQFQTLIYTLCFN